MLSNLAADRRPGSSSKRLGASLIKLRKYGHKFLGFTGFRIDFLQSVHQFEVFGTKLVEQRLSLFAERFKRLGIILLLSRFDLIFELGEIANSVPSTQMRCMITANRRASATIAFF